MTDETKLLNMHIMWNIHFYAIIAAQNTNAHKSNINSNTDDIQYYVFYKIMLNFRLLCKLKYKIIE